ncbi:hypothetical protein B296_00037159 [Ensete ventricosum]|uniref:Uncharacterized protein n=1 Tax=Ensete ventricosum TaxID=4639 RepID=A0A426YXB5_ENSVE|nr:hypothetical protein B296_00037159 [Ensete ventricosum]
MDIVFVQCIVRSHNTSCDVDRPDGQPCLETKEFSLIRNMLTAVVEERYTDAGKTFSVEGPASSAQIQETELGITGFGATLCSLFSDRA